MMAGKMTCYEEDIKVPFYATGPGIAKGLVKKTRTSHVDIAPTFARYYIELTLFRIAGTPIPDFVDGIIEFFDSRHHYSVVPRREKKP